MMAIRMESSDVSFAKGPIRKRDTLLNLGVILSFPENATPDSGKGIMPMLVGALGAHVNMSRV